MLGIPRHLMPKIQIIENSSPKALTIVKEQVMSSAIGRWKEKVEAHHIQSMNAQRVTNWTSDDNWTVLSVVFVTNNSTVPDRAFDL